MENPDFPLYPIRFENKNEPKVTKDIREKCNKERRTEQRVRGQDKRKRWRKVECNYIHRDMKHTLIYCRLHTHTYCMQQRSCIINPSYTRRLVIWNRNTSVLGINSEFTDSHKIMHSFTVHANTHRDFDSTHFSFILYYFCTHMVTLEVEYLNKIQNSII